MKHGHLNSEISRNGILQVVFANLVRNRLCCDQSTGHRITDLFFVSLSARGLAHCGYQLPQVLPHVVCCCFLSVGIHIRSLPHNSIQFPFQLVGGICFLVNEGIQYTVTK